MKHECFSLKGGRQETIRPSGALSIQRTTEKDCVQHPMSSLRRALSASNAGNPRGRPHVSCDLSRRRPGGVSFLHNARITTRPKSCCSACVGNWQRQVLDGGYRVIATVARARRLVPAIQLRKSTSPKSALGNQASICVRRLRLSSPRGDTPISRLQAIRDRRRGERRGRTLCSYQPQMSSNAVASGIGARNSPRPGREKRGFGFQDLDLQRIASGSIA